jgi:hypothetical protein
MLRPRPQRRPAPLPSSVAQPITSPRHGDPARVREQTFGARLGAAIGGGIIRGWPMCFWDVPIFDGTTGVQCRIGSASDARPSYLDYSRQVKAVVARSPRQCSPGAWEASTAWYSWQATCFPMSVRPGSPLVYFASVPCVAQSARQAGRSS